METVFSMYSVSYEDTAGADFISKKSSVFFCSRNWVIDCDVYYTHTK